MKKQVEMSLLGANKFYETKVALRQCQLNLSAWHGFQGVLYKEQVNPKEIQFKFFLTDDSYVYFLFNMNSEKFSGIRISANNAFENMLVEGYNSGEFTKKTKLALNNIKKNSWNYFRLITNNEGFSIVINDIVIGDFKEVVLERQYFGFRGSYRPVFLDDVTVRQRGSDVIIRESFCNTKNRFQSLSLIFLMLIMISLIVGSFRAIRKSNFKKICFSLILFNLVVFIMSVTLLLGYYYANEIKIRYPKMHGIFRNIMKQERIFVNRDAEYVTGRIMNLYKTEDAGNTKRILFLGTSQTRGAGAATAKESFVNVTEDILNQKGNGKYECINAGVHGANSTGIIKYYEKSWITLKPAITVINLSNNDNNEKDFDINMERFVRLNKSKGIGTVFVLEANSREVKTDLPSFHNIMREIAVKEKIVIIDLHKYLLEKNDSGILWWDAVHMTSYGQKLMAEYISDKILPYLDD